MHSNGIAVASLALLFVAPIILLGADYLFDEILNVKADLATKVHYRAFLYLSVIAICSVVLFQSLGAYGWVDTFRITSQSLISIISILLLGFFFGKWSLQRSWVSREAKRIERLELELPQYLEMFHILITSGMSVLSALKALSRSGHDFAASDVHSMAVIRQKRSEMGRARSEMGQVVLEVLQGVQRGLAIERALDQVVMKAGSEQLRRFSDAVILGMERGSSMGQTLRNLINETRTQSKILVMQRAGKAEIKLLIPVVFLILPISVMFAIWPSYMNLASIMGG